MILDSVHCLEISLLPDDISSLEYPSSTFDQRVTEILALQISRLPLRHRNALSESPQQKGVPPIHRAGTIYENGVCGCPASLYLVR